MSIDVATSLDELKFRDKDAFWAARLGAELVKAYPGHGWEVHSDIQNGICNIFNRHMSPLHGYRLKLSEVNHNTLSRDVVRIGGEILERFGLSREVFDPDAIRQIQHDTNGRAQADLT